MVLRLRRELLPNQNHIMYVDQKHEKEVIVPTRNLGKKKRNISPVTHHNVCVTNMTEVGITPDMLRSLKATCCGCGHHVIFTDESLGTPTGLGIRIQEVRRLKGFSQQQLASKIGIAQSVIGKVEIGLTRTPSSGTLKALASALGVSVYWLKTGKEKQ